MRGIIKTVIVPRGFGFVRRADDGTDIFLHVYDLPPQTPFDDRLVGQLVEFEVQETTKGPRAAHVRFVD